MPRRTKAEYEEDLKTAVVSRLRRAEIELREAYRGFLVVGPKDIAKDFGRDWGKIISQIEDHIQAFHVGEVRINHHDFLEEVKGAS